MHQFLEKIKTRSTVHDCVLESENKLGEAFIFP